MADFGYTEQNFIAFIFAYFTFDALSKISNKKLLNNLLFKLILNRFLK
jgi:hypothetical protein